MPDYDNIIADIQRRLKNLEERVSQIEEDYYAEEGEENG